MTNYEKFIEVFGRKPETGCPFNCSEYENCPYEETNKSCRTDEFWNTEWKETKSCKTCIHDGELTCMAIGCDNFERYERKVTV